MRQKAIRWGLLVMSGGFLLQTGQCVLSDAFFDQILIPQLTSVISDTVFFFLDNALVRLGT